MAVTIDCAKECTIGDLRSGEPFAQRFDRAGIIVFAERDRDFVAGLLAIARLHFNPATCRLAVSEHSPLRMSLGQWSGRSRIAEVRRPVPVPDLGHVLKVLANVVVMFF